MNPVNSAAFRRASATTFSSIDRLGLGGREPPRVEQEAVVSFGEVEAEPAGLEADWLKTSGYVVTTTSAAATSSIVRPDPRQRVGDRVDAEPWSEARRLRHPVGHGRP